jgi:hypothetical protein
MPTAPIAVIGGIDTHKHLHHAAVLDSAGRLLGHAGFPASPAGHAACWAGWAATASSRRSGWKAPAATAPGSPGS